MRTNDHDETVGEQPVEDSPTRVQRAANGLRSALTGHAAASLRTGSGILIRKGWNLLPDDGVWVRLGYAGGGAYVVGYTATHTPMGAAGPFVIPGTVIAWCVAAWTIAPPPGRADLPPEPDDEQEWDDEPTPELAAIVALVRKVAGTQHQGAHLADLIETGELGDWEQSDLKAALTSDWGIPVNEIKLRVGGRQRVRDGVRLRDLPAGLGEAPASSAPEAALSAPVEAAPDPSPRPLPDRSQGPG